MLNILIGKENKPKDLIIDVDKHLAKTGIRNTVVNNIVLRYLELSKYNDEESFIDKYGYKVNFLKLSTGSKILIVMNEFQNVPVDGAELGQNAFEIMTQYSDGTIYFDSTKRFDLPEVVDLDNISVNGIIYKDNSDLGCALWKK